MVYFQRLGLNSTACTCWWKGSRTGRTPCSCSSARTPAFIEGFFLMIEVDLHPPTHSVCQSVTSATFFVFCLISQKYSFAQHVLLPVFANIKKVLHCMADFLSVCLFIVCLLLYLSVSFFCPLLRSSIDSFFCWFFQSDLYLLAHKNIQEFLEYLDILNSLTKLTKIVQKTLEFWIYQVKVKWGSGS